MESGTVEAYGSVDEVIVLSLFGVGFIVAVLVCLCGATFTNDSKKRLRWLMGGTIGVVAYMWLLFPIDAWNSFSAISE